MEVNLSNNFMDIVEKSKLINKNPEELKKTLNNNEQIIMFFPEYSLIDLVTEHEFTVNELLKLQYNIKNNIYKNLFILKTRQLLQLQLRKEAMPLIEIKEISNDFTEKNLTNLERDKYKDIENEKLIDILTINAENFLDNLDFSITNLEKLDNKYFDNNLIPINKINENNINIFNLDTLTDLYILSDNKELFEYKDNKIQETIKLTLKNYSNYGDIKQELLKEKIDIFLSDKEKVLQLLNEKIEIDNNINFKNLNKEEVIYILDKLSNLENRKDFLSKTELNVDDYPELYIKYIDKELILDGRGVNIKIIGLPNNVSKFYKYDFNNNTNEELSFKLIKDNFKNHQKLLNGEKVDVVYKFKFLSTEEQKELKEEYLSYFNSGYNNKEIFNVLVPNLDNNEIIKMFYKNQDKTLLLSLENNERIKEFNSIKDKLNPYKNPEQKKIIKTFVILNLDKITNISDRNIIGNTLLGLNKNFSSKYHNWKIENTLLGLNENLDYLNKNDFEKVLTPDIKLNENRSYRNILEEIFNKNELNNTEIINIFNQPNLNRILNIVLNDETVMENFNNIENRYYIHTLDIILNNKDFLEVFKNINDDKTNNNIFKLLENFYRETKNETKLNELKEKENEFLTTNYDKFYINKYYDGKINLLSKEELLKVLDFNEDVAYCYIQQTTAHKYINDEEVIDKLLNITSGYHNDEMFKILQLNDFKEEIIVKYFDKISPSTKNSIIDETGDKYFKLLYNQDKAAYDKIINFKNYVDENYKSFIKIMSNAKDTDNGGNFVNIDKNFEKSLLTELTNQGLELKISTKQFAQTFFKKESYAIFSTPKKQYNDTGEFINLFINNISIKEIKSLNNDDILKELKNNINNKIQETKIVKENELRKEYKKDKENDLTEIK